MTNEEMAQGLEDLASVELREYPGAVEVLRAGAAALRALEWTSRERKMRQAISEAFSAQTMNEVSVALRPIITDDDCMRPEHVTAPPKEGV